MRSPTPSPSRRAVAVLALCAALAAAEDAPHVAVAKEFVRAFEAKDDAAMILTARQPARRVDYSLVIYSMLQGGERDAARKLAELRAGAPEGAGLKRLVDVFERGGRPPESQSRASVLAERLLQEKRPEEALRALAEGGTPLEGTITGARIEWTRARALAAIGETREAVEAYGECARLARTTGWIQLAGECERRRLQIARADASMAGQAKAAAGALIEDARAADNRAAEMNARVARAELLLAEGDTEKARADYGAAIDLARALELREFESKLLGKLAWVLHVREGHPRRAKLLYAKALDVLLALGDEAGVAKARFNLARVLTDLAEYEEALAQLSEAERLGELPDELERPIRHQRAYVYRQQGRLARSRDEYLALLGSVPSPAEATALNLELGELHLLRGDFFRARDRFRAAPAGGVRAMAGEAAALGGLQREEESRAAFAAAVAAAPAREAKGRLRLQWSAFERAFGRVDRAIELAEEALADLAREDSTDYGNAAAAWTVLGDLRLLDGRPAPALDALAKAAVFHFRSRDPGRAVPAYARETLVLLSQEKMFEEATQRRGTLIELAAGVNDPRLKSMAACVDAVWLHRANKPGESAVRFEEAAAHAREAGDAELEATALATRGLLAGAPGLPFARQAIALLDARPEWRPMRHPLVVGERPDDAASIALRCLLESGQPDAREAFALVERVKAQRIEIALRGRDAILVRQLPEERFGAYVDARSDLREARRREEGVAEAEAAYRALARELAAAAPLAFPARPDPAAVQAALGKDEILLLFVSDAYVNALVLVERGGIEVRAFDPQKPLDGLDKKLAGKRRALLSPEGFLSLAPPDGVEIAYVGSAATLLARKARKPAERPLAHVERTVRVDLHHPPASDAWPRDGEHARVVVLDRVDLAPGPSAEGYAAVALPRLLAGADAVVLSLTGATDPRLVQRFLQEMGKPDAKPAAALEAVRAWAKQQEGLNRPTQWASLVLWEG